MKHKNTSLQETMGADYMYAEPVIEAQEEREPGLGKYKALSVIIFLLAAGGLFINMLGYKFPQYFPTYLLGGDNVFDYSICGYLINVFKNIQSVFMQISFTTSSGILKLFFLLLIFCAGIGAVLSLVLMVLTLIASKKKTAKNCAMFSAIFTFLVYGGLLFVFYFTSMGLSGNMGLSSFDVPIMIIAALSLIALIVVAIGRSKSTGLINVMLILCVILAIIGLSWPATITASFAPASLDMLISKQQIFFAISLVILVAMLAINFFFAAIRMNAKRGYGFDVFRYTLQLVGALLVVIASFFTDPNSRWFMFQGTQLISTLIFVIASILSFLISVLYFALHVVKKPAHDEEEYEEESEQPIVQQPVYMPEPQIIQQPVYMPEQPIIQQPVYVAPEPQIIQQPVYVAPEPQIIQQPVYIAPEPQIIQQPVYVAPEPIVQEQRVVHEHVYQQPPQPEPVVQEQRIIHEHVYQPPQNEPPKPLTDFERRMQALANTEIRVQQNAQQTVKQEKTSYVRKQKAVPHGNYSYEGTQYKYDPFINTLTPEERNEFGDIFIANVYGLHSYLPTYVIGGDNKTFFNRVFIYLGNYRNYISQNLLDKIYLYVSKL